MRIPIQAGYGELPRFMVLFLWELWTGWRGFLVRLLDSTFAAEQRLRVNLPSLVRVAIALMRASLRLKYINNTRLFLVGAGEGLISWLWSAVQYYLLYVIVSTAARCK